MNRATFIPWRHKDDGPGGRPSICRRAVAHLLCGLSTYGTELLNCGAPRRMGVKFAILPSAYGLFKIHVLGKGGSNSVYCASGDS